MTDASTDRPQADHSESPSLPAGYQITVCPSCSTAFRVSEAQLKAAAGQVRCGMCLTLFDGVEALSTIPPVGFAQQKEALEAIDSLIAELLVDDRVVESNSEPPVVPPQAAASEAAPSPEPPKFEPEPPVPAQPEPQPVQAAQAPVLEVVDTERLEERGSPVAVPSNPASSDAAAGDLVSSTAHSPSAEPSALPAPEEAEAMDAPLQDVQPTEVAPAAAASKDPRSRRATPKRATPKKSSSKTPAPTRSETTSASSQVAPTETLSAEARSAAAALARRISLRPPRRLWLGFVLVPFGLLVVASFAIWLQFDSLARSEFRPALVRICAGVGCQLPERRALDQIKVESLKFSPASDQPGKLRVRISMVNKAPFEQRFPTLELRFSTVVGGLVAGHRFLPAEYLVGESAALIDMPVNTPIQFERIIPEPGPHAVNYTLDLR